MLDFCVGRLVQVEHRSLSMWLPICIVLFVFVSVFACVSVCETFASAVVQVERKDGHREA